MINWFSFFRFYLFRQNNIYYFNISHLSLIGHIGHIVLIIIDQNLSSWLTLYVSQFLKKLTEPSTLLWMTVQPPGSCLWSHHTCISLLVFSGFTRCMPLLVWPSSRASRQSFQGPKRARKNHSVFTPTQSFPDCFNKMYPFILNSQRSFVFLKEAPCLLLSNLILGIWHCDRQKYCFAWREIQVQSWNNCIIKESLSQDPPVHRSQLHLLSLGLLFFCGTAENALNIRRGLTLAAILAWEVASAVPAKHNAGTDAKERPIC